MQNLDFVYLTLQSFRTRKSRFFFTVLSVAVAIATVLILVSFGYGLQASLIKQISTTDTITTLDVTTSSQAVLPLTGDALNTFRNVPGVRRLSPVATTPVQYRVKNITTSANLTVVQPEYVELSGATLAAGKFPVDTKHQGMITSTLALLLDLPQDASVIGKEITITPDDTNLLHGTRTLTVSGLLAGEKTDTTVYVSADFLDSAATLTYQSVKIQANDTNVLSTIRATISSQGYLVSALSDTVEQANKIFKVIQVTLGIFGTVALVVAAIGLINTMTISLLERTNEIGIMRAIGASTTDVRKTFLGESTLIGFSGGLVGIGAGIAGAEGINWIFNILAKSLGGQPMRIFVYPIWFIVFIILLSTVVGFIAGVWPAKRAAIMNPLEALRYK